MNSNTENKLRQTQTNVSVLFIEKENEMSDSEQRFNEIADKLKELSKDEKKFILWFLLREYGEENAKEIPERSDTLEDYRKEKFYRDLCCDCNNLFETLSFELW